MLVRKSFDHQDYDRCDERAKAAAIGWLTRRGHTQIDAEERYSYDIVSRTAGGDLHFCEVEIKECWKGPWPTMWNSVHLPERRRRAVERWYDSGQEGQLVFLLFRSDLQQAWCIDASLITYESLKEVRNRCVAISERMFNVDLQRASLIDFAAAGAAAARDEPDEVAPAFIF